ncbi:hypothetical protein [Lentzea tibetensis]|uniref:hypothetical protein n=1 Tax=Lentzea tibetensis TaxID=2591470 RepID=UPI001F3A8721|nr:hypothetical protein [Lentzea tibetensis]
MRGGRFTWNFLVADVWRVHGYRQVAWGDDVGVSRRGWVVWIVVGFVVAAVGGATALVDLESADKIGSVVGAVCGALGLVLSGYGLVKSRHPQPVQPGAARGDPVVAGPVENAISESTVIGSVVQAGSVDGSVVIGEGNIVGDHHQVASHGGVVVGAGGQVVLPQVIVPEMESVPAMAALGRLPVGPRVFVGRLDELTRLDWTWRWPVPAGRWWWRYTVWAGWGRAASRRASLSCTRPVFPWCGG